MPCLCVLGAACGPLGEAPLGRESEAVNVCDETVPSNRFVDGLPAYAQCDATTGSIWSNNGVDTATSKQGDDWLLTQQSGGYQCTEWAWRYMHFHFGVDYRHGDARQWCDGTLPATLVKSTTPVHGDLIVFDAGVCGADATTGHVAVVDTVDVAKAKVTLVEENQAGRRSANQSCALCFLHAVANDGMSAGAAGGAGVSGGAGAASGAGAANGGAMSRGGAPSFAGATASGGMAARAAGGAFSTAGRGTGGSAPVGSGGATNDGGRPGSVDGGVPNAGTTGHGGTSGTGVSDVGGTSGTVTAGGAAGAGSGSSAAAGRPDAGEGGPRDDGLPSESANPGGGCQLGSRAPGGGAGWLLALSYWVAARKRRSGGRRLPA